MNLTITLKPNDKLILNNTHNCVFNITHISKMSNKCKGILYINKNNEKLEVAKVDTNSSIKVNLFIFIDINSKDTYSLECSGCVIDLFGLIEFEECDIPFVPFSLNQGKVIKRKINSDSESENFDNENKESVSLETLINNSQKQQKKDAKQGFSLTNIKQKGKNIKI